MDNASFHKSKKLKIPENINIEYILPYSPELNPQERRFEDIKKFLKNLIFNSLEELEKKVEKNFTFIYTYTNQIFSFL